MRPLLVFGGKSICECMYLISIWRILLENKSRNNLQLVYFRTQIYFVGITFVGGYITIAISHLSLILLKMAL